MEQPHAVTDADELDALLDKLVLLDDAAAVLG